MATLRGAQLDLASPRALPSTKVGGRHGQDRSDRALRSRACAEQKKSCASTHIRSPVRAILEMRKPSTLTNERWGRFKSIGTRTTFRPRHIDGPGIYPIGALRQNGVGFEQVF